MEERTKKERRGGKLGPELGGRPECRDKNKKERREEEGS
jgi:hypothetical protein